MRRPRADRHPWERDDASRYSPGLPEAGARGWRGPSDPTAGASAAGLVVPVVVATAHLLPPQAPLGEGEQELGAVRGVVACAGVGEEGGDGFGELW